MEDYRNDYPEYDDEPGASSPDKSIRGYRVVIILLAVILAAMSIHNYNTPRQQLPHYYLLLADPDPTHNTPPPLLDDFDNLRINNDSISASLGMERERADSLMERLKKERSWSYAKIKQYEKEVGTLQTLMRNYLRQIDSLNTLNKQLISENVSYRKEISTISQRAELAEEKAAELDNMVKQGSVLKARNIRLTSLNTKSKEVTRIKNAARLRTDFTLAANELTTPGDKTVYVRILAPDGYVLSSEGAPTFDYEGERLSYSAQRSIDYQNEDIDVGIFYNGSGFTAGKYTVQLYAEGRLIGSAEIVMR
ncbi:hypothetical protein [uncultured Alistipes sp.]|uniref:hypothetical protein n=1 Tax=uncultured Alistipes sp. TaxID=538949 RepID=UPI00261F2CBD|nr:hypothetical protein [uncultured Alistipes sp.]